MRRLIPFILCLSVWAGAESQAGEAFKLTDLKGDFPGSGVYGVGSPGMQSPFKKEPEYKVPPAYGKMQFGSDRPLDFVLFNMTGVGDPDTVIIDINGDGDLTNDQAIPLPGKDETAGAEIVLGGKTVPVKIKTMGSNIFRILPAKGYRGEVELDGKKIGALMVDGDFNGFQETGSNMSDLLLLDLNGDGEFRFVEQTYDIECFIPLQSLALVNGRTMRMKIDKAAPSVEFTPYDGETGKLDIQVELGDEWKKGERLTALLRQRAIDNLPVMEQFVDFQKQAEPISIPTGGYDQAVMILRKLGADGKLQGFIQAQLTPQKEGDPAVTIEAGKTRTLTIAPPTGITPEVTQENKTLKIKRGLVTRGEFQSAMIMTVDEKGEMTQIPAPTVKIHKTGITEPVAKATMEYG